MKLLYVSELAEKLKSDTALQEEIKKNPADKIAELADTPPKFNHNLIRLLISLFAVVVVTTHILLKFEIKNEDLALLAIALIPWLFAFIESLKFGKDGIEIVTKKLEEAKEELKTQINDKTAETKEEFKTELKEKTETLATETAEQIKQVTESNNLTQSIAAFGTGGKTTQDEKTYREELKQKTKNPDDPQKGQWGGASEDPNMHRKMSAEVTKIANENYFRRVVFRVESTSPRDSPLTETVIFHLHPTFARPVIQVKPVNNVAEIVLTAYGAFTAGAETDNGKTRLEFDLAQLDDHEDPFFKR